MDAGIDDKGVGLCDFVEGERGIAGDDFDDGAEGMFFIAGVDAFGGVAEAEVAVSRLRPEIFSRIGRQSSSVQPG